MALTVCYERVLYTGSQTKDIRLKWVIGFVEIEIPLHCFWINSSDGSELCE